MTLQHNASPAPEETSDAYITAKQSTATRLIQGCYDEKQIGEDDYLRLIAERCAETEWDDIYNHFTFQLIELGEAVERHLLERIVKGATFIDSLAKNDPRLKPAEAKYDALCAQLEKHRGRR